MGSYNTLTRIHPKQKKFPMSASITDVNGDTSKRTNFSSKDFGVSLIPSAGKQITESYRSGGRYDMDVTPEDLIRDSGCMPSTYDNGHPFKTVQNWLTTSHENVSVTNPDWEDWYNGPLFFTLRDAIVEDWDQRHYGTVAFNATYPTKSVAGMATFLGELKDGLPKMLGSSLYKLVSKNSFWGHNPAKGLGSELGSEYLNFVFGWEPFVADLKKMLYVVLNSYELIKQYKRDSGRVVRRKYHFADTSSTTVEENVNLLLNINGPSPFSNGTLMLYGRWPSGGTIPDPRGSIVRRQFASYKFTGAFSYYLNMDDSFMGRMEYYSQQANHLLGLRLTPDVVWNLAPWSWLADWFSDIGISLENTTALSNDGLVLRYGYLQRKATAITLSQAPEVQTRSGTFRNVSTVQTQIVKERVKSPTPYGWGLELPDLSDKQWSILAALGMSRGSGTRSLRGSGT